MTGLYPPGTASHSDVRVQFGQDALHEDEGGLPHLIQPVPIHTTSRFDERLLLPGANCLRHDALMHQLYTSQQFRDKADAEKPFLQIAAKVAGLPPANFTFFNLEALSDTWTCNRAHHVPLPAGATPDVVEHARNLSNWLLTLSNTGLEVNRLRSGLLLHDIKSRMLMSALHSENRLPKSYNDQLRKFVLYSAHDTTVAAALASLQVFDGIYPSYNSTLIWELYKAADGTYLVRLEYNGAALTLPGCSSEYCPAAEYLKSTHERTIPGRVARDFECIIGWRRYASMISPPFWKTDDNELEGFGIFGDEGGSSGGFGVLQIAISIMAIILVIAVVRIAFRYQSKYSGYSRPKGDTIAANRRVGHEHMSLTDTPILM